MSAPLYKGRQKIVAVFFLKRERYNSIFRLKFRILSAIDFFKLNAMLNILKKTFFGLMLVATFALGFSCLDPDESGDLPASDKLSRIQLPPGFSISLYAEDVENPGGN